jgi:hypothetical protein
MTDAGAGLDEAPKTPEEAIRFQVRDLVASCVREDTTGPEKIVLDAKGVATISEAVDQVLDTLTLMEVVDAILVIGHYVETELGAPQAAKLLVDIVNREAVIDSMKRVNDMRTTADREKARKAAEAFASFTERRRELAIQMTAPGVGDEDPDGTVKLNSLKFPKRL